MQNSSPNKKRLKRILFRFLFVLLLLFVLANLAILITGKTYLYKGVQVTYLQGKTGPGIYDSIIFPNRIAQKSKHPYHWEVKSPTIPLSQSMINTLSETQTTSFLIVKDQKVIHESYYNGHTKHTKSNSFSVAKSFIGLLIGIAVDHKEITSFDAPISDYLPFRLKNDENITIRHLLGMSSGIYWTESGSNPFSDNAEAYYTSNLDQLMRKKQFLGEPATTFEYASGNSQLLGMILEEATGKTPTAYFAEHIWEKIGAKHHLLWSLDHKNGTEKTFCCAYATTRDYALIGQLVLNQGMWGKEEVISSKTLNEILAPFNAKEPFYGLHFWRFEHPEHPAIYARGILGQYIIVVPSLNVVMVRTGHERKEKYFIPKEKREDTNFVLENKYKEHQPLDLFDYFSALDYILDFEN